MLKANLRSPKLPAALLTAGLVVIGAAAIWNHYRAAAAGTAVLYLAPSSASYASGATFNVAVRINPNGENVNAIQANLTYPTGQLQYQSTNTSGSGFDITAPSSGGSGTVSIARGSTTGVTGDVVVATVVFKAIATGSAPVGVTASSAAPRTSDATDALGSRIGATYTLTAAPTPTPTPASTPAPATKTPTPAPGATPKSVVATKPPVATKAPAPAAVAQTPSPSAAAHKHAYVPTSATKSAANRSLRTMLMWLLYILGAALLGISGLLWRINRISAPNPGPSPGDGTLGPMTNTDMTAPAAPSKVFTPTDKE